MDLGFCDVFLCYLFLIIIEISLKMCFLLTVSILPAR